MKPDMFERPVGILVGLGFPAEIRSVMDAYRLLVEWRHSSGTRPIRWRLRPVWLHCAARLKQRLCEASSSPSPKDTICWPQ